MNTMNREQRRAHEKAHRRFYRLLECWGRLTEEQKLSDAGKHMMEDMLICAPPEISQQLREKADSLGLYPKARYCDENGEPVFTEYEVAEHFGIPVEEVRTMTDAMIRRHGENGDIRLVDVDTLNPIH